MKKKLIFLASGVIILLLGVTRLVGATGAITDSYFWSLDKGTGTVGYNQTANTSPINWQNTPSWADGKYGKAIQFNGVNQYGIIDDADGFSFGNGTTDTPFSISAWVKMTDSAYFDILAKYNNHEEWALFTDNHKLVFIITDASASASKGRKYNTSIASYDGQWINITATYDGSRTVAGLKIYLNGNRVDDANYTDNVNYVAMENTTDPVWIGNWFANYATGYEDNIRIFNGALTQTEITDIYNNNFLTDNFDTYSVNNPINNNGNWTQESPYPTTVVNTKSVSASNSIYSGLDLFRGLYNNSFYSSSGSLSYYIYLVGAQDWWSRVDFDTYSGDTFGIRFSKTEGGFGYHAYNDVWISTPVTDIWLNIRVQWQVNSGVLQFKYSYDGTTWSAWINPLFYTSPNKQAIHDVYIHGWDYGNGREYNYLDSFSASLPVLCNERTDQTDCTTHSCYWHDSACWTAAPACNILINQGDCLLNSCHWYAGTCHIAAPASCGILTIDNDCRINACCWNYGGFCQTCDTSRCASGIFGCGFCNNLTLCGATSGCTWYATYCALTGGTCTASTLGWCQSQSTCEAVNGHWYGGICNSVPQLSLGIESWADYYTANGSYETPSAIVSTIAGVFQTILDQIGTFIMSFNSTFSPTIADADGNSLGLVIPQARGFLIPINDFLGNGFPISELLIFCLLTAMAVAVFRAAARLWQAIRG